jgi:tagaturonate epimerase
MGLTENMATTLLALNSLDVRPNSAVCVEGTEAGLVGSSQRVAILAPSGSQVPSNFEGESSVAGGRTLVIGPMNAANLDALRDLLPWLRPRPLGPSTSAGFGDRLGLATPGHVRALRAAGGELAPIFAQQSIREMERTGRSPQEVLDDTALGVFAEGWKEGFGADADHLKTTEDIDACVAAGYTFFTFDPGEYVDAAAEAAGASALHKAFEDLPWRELKDHPADMKKRYLDAVMETAGLYNTAGFNDDTRAFASIPSRHDVWRRITCDWLAGMVLTGVVDEEEATDMAREFAYGLAKRAYGFQRESVGGA